MRVIFAALLLSMLPGDFASAQLTHNALPTFEVAGAPRQLRLADGLREVSGLAAASENSVYAHNDEHGIVYEIDLRDGSTVSAFAFGKPTVSADFEGIAVNNGRVYLVTSNGLVYEGLIGEHRKRVRYNIFDTGVGAYCEVEGLTVASEEGNFFILCKAARAHDLEGRLIIYRWSVTDRTPVAEPWLSIPYGNFLSQQDANIFRPSGLGWDEERKMLVVLSARSHKLVVVNVMGDLLYEMDMSQDFHAQPEGVLLTPDGDLIIADEGPGRRPGMLSIYKLHE